MGERACGACGSSPRCEDQVALWARERQNDARWMREQYAQTESLADLMWKQSQYFRTGA